MDWGDGVHEPEFFELAHDVVASDEAIAEDWIAYCVGNLDGFSDGKVADFADDFEEKGLPGFCDV